ncbi:MAG: cation:dicarboxylase symporter family transporter, partial [Sphingomonadales bacterium]|nr:cation:dicarboxylase symporter family transporter [Sphingomonadales bacterium]
MKKTNKLTTYILLSMVAGVLVGYEVHTNADPAFIKEFSTNIKLLGKVFIRMVQMIIAPLVFSTLVVGIAKLGNLSAVGRVGGKSML